ncbi:hypothetical protein MTR_5g054800 [Medicago truncatula]|uniref:Uncharacterized protein n=1 Tax=Medicago truncatula TaxID=3880 RepID=G7JYE4_MEDTR|nr:hypothetical protein MTR_5g054800 [Medicago truncatula]
MKAKLGKWWWRLKDEPDCLWFRVLAAGFGEVGRFLHARKTFGMASSPQLPSIERHFVKERGDSGYFSILCGMVW